MEIYFSYCFPYTYTTLQDYLYSLSINPLNKNKLRFSKLNRSIRSYIRDAGDKLRPRLKQEDIPANKIISYELFNSIVEECEIQLKEGYMEVLLYQMKMKVPKGKGFNTLNAIVIVDFLK